MPTKATTVGRQRLTLAARRLPPARSSSWVSSSARAVARPTTFLLGQVDTLPLGGFDSSCPAMAQGATRRARGEAYVKYINEKLGAKHAIQIVSECGHNDRCVYTTDAVLPVIFPKAP